jgi:hypothetical protein
MMRVSVDITFFKNELLRMSVPVLRTIDLDALQIFKAVHPRHLPEVQAHRFAARSRVRFVDWG